MINDYIRSELLVLAPVLYYIGTAIKNSSKIKDNFIPFILGGISIVLCAIWVLANEPINDWRTALTAVFTSIVQGVLIAAASVYVNQGIKQLQELKEGKIDE